MARIELDRTILAEGLQMAKVQSLQLESVRIQEDGPRLVIDGPAIVIARAWVVDPEAWRSLPGSVREGRVLVFDATQMKVADRAEP